MKNGTGYRRGVSCLGAAAFIGGGLMAADASANLKIELIATNISGRGVISADGKSVTGALVGTVISYNVVAEIYGASVTNPGMQSGAGGVFSLSGSTYLKGNLTQTNAPLFATGAFLNGTPFADANGNTQVGPTTGPTTVANNSFGRISYLAATVIAGSAVVMGSGTYTVTSLNGTSSTGLSFRIATTTTTNKNPLWRETGANATFNQSTGTIDPAAPLTISAVTPFTLSPGITGGTDLIVAGNGAGNFSPTALAFGPLLTGSKTIQFGNPGSSGPSTVIVGVDLSGTQADLAALIPTLNADANSSGVFFGLGGPGVYDVIATFTGVTGSSFTFGWAGLGNVHVVGLAVIPEPGCLIGVPGVMALCIRRRRSSMN